MIDFDTFFDSSLASILQPLEKRRKRYFKGRYIILLIICLISIILVSLSFLTAYIPFWTLFVAIPSLILLGLLIYKSFFGNVEKLGADFKELILSKIPEQLGGSFDYSPKDYIPYKLFKQSKLFLNRPDHYIGDDLVHGNVGGTDIQFSELNVGYKVFDKNEKERWSVIFNGLFFVANSHVPFATSVLIIPNRLRTYFKRSGKNIHKNNMMYQGEYVLINDDEFNKEYVVYAQDPVLAKEIVNKDLIQQLLLLRRTGRRPYVSFQGTQMSIAIKFKRPLFEMDIRKSFLNKKYIQTFFDDMSFGVTIAHSLGLGISSFESDGNLELAIDPETLMQNLDIPEDETVTDETD